MAAYRRMDGLVTYGLVTCELTAVQRDQLRAQRSVTSMGELYPFNPPQNEEERCEAFMEPLSLLDASKIAGHFYFKETF